LLETQFSWYLDTNLTTVISGYTNWGTGGPYLNQYHRDLCIAANFRYLWLVEQQCCHTFSFLENFNSFKKTCWNVCKFCISFLQLWCSKLVLISKHLIIIANHAVS